MTTRDTPEAALKAAGFEPPENVCASCGHDGGDHDGGNWCLLCPRPNRPARPIAGRLAVGWCYFASMTEEQKWEHGLAALPDWTLVPNDPVERAEVEGYYRLLDEGVKKQARLEDAEAEIARLTNIVKRASGMGLCSQTHHEHLLVDARAALGPKP